MSDDRIPRWLPGGAAGPDDDGGENFERAIQESRARWGVLGDPLTWGGTSDVIFTVPGGGPFTGQAFGKQAVRVQTKDLLARSWDLTCTLVVTGFVTPGDTVVEASMEVTYGVGQVTGVGFMQLAHLGGGPVAQGDWLFHGTVDTISLLVPVPAAALSARLFVSMTSTAAAHVVTFASQVVVSPRALA